MKAIRISIQSSLRICLSVFVMSIITMTITAQTYSNKVSIGIGALYERGFDATISAEHQSKNHNAWEYFINGYLKWKECEDCGHVCSDSFWKNYNTWSVGAAYKPCVYTGRNNHGNLRIGLSAGSNTDEFLGGVHVGYEHNYILKKGLTIFWQAKCDCIIPDTEDLFRTGIVIGIKLPTSK